MRLKRFINEIISKEEWKEKYRKKVMQTFDPDLFKKSFKGVKDLFKKMNGGKLKKSLIFDFKGTVAETVNDLDENLFITLEEFGYTFKNKYDDYLRGICYKKNKEKSIYSILEHMATQDLDRLQKQ